MPVRRVLRRAAVAALVACAAMLIPAAPHAPAAGVPGAAAKSTPVSVVLATAHRHPERDEFDVATQPALVWTVPLPTPTDIATPAPPPAPPAVIAAQPASNVESIAQPPAVIAQPAAVVAPPFPQAAAGDWYDATFASEVRDLVDAERAKVGLGPLAVEPRLTVSAMGYAKVLGSGAPFSHVGPDGSTLVTRAETAGFPFTVRLGEVLAWGTESWTPAGIVQAWMHSPTHREEIMNGDYIEAGTGCYFTPANGVTVYCVMDLAA